jgi:hypothetical protein
MSNHHNSTVDSARRLAELRQENAEPTAETAEEGINVESMEEQPAFSMVSADRMRKVMVEFRMLKGDVKARPYAFLAGIDYNPDTGIVVDFSADKVTITGRNLRPLLSGLISQRVAVVREMDDMQAEANVPDGETVVLKIEVKPVE